MWLGALDKVTRLLQRDACSQMAGKEKKDKKQVYSSNRRLADILFAIDRRKLFLT